jgi:hypothetical protein
MQVLVGDERDPAQAVDVLDLVVVRWGWYRAVRWRAWTTRP